MLKFARQTVIASLLVVASASSAFAAEKDIVDTAVAAGSFNTLVTAVTKADLAETLKGSGPFTVFAPNDDAFAKIPAETLNTLLDPSNKGTLAGILTYHVIAGKVMSADIVGKSLSVDTVNGAPVTIDATDGVMVGGAKVIAADIETSNGVIHVIDTVIMPPK